jgi:hypothetical protein
MHDYDLQFNKSSVAKPNHPIPAGTSVYRQNPGNVNSPNAPGGEVPRNTIAERGGKLIKE